MQRLILALILSTALVVMGVVLNDGTSPEDAGVDAVAAQSNSGSAASSSTEADSLAADTTTTTARTSSSSEASSTTVDSTSTTAGATPTTEATPQSTTTTKVLPASTTTTVAPVTSSKLTIPATVTYPLNGFKEAGGYDFMASNADTGILWWSTPYLGTTLPYSPGSKWVAGDRESYKCGYGFVQNPSGDINGRFAFVRPPDQAYGKVNDRYMDESVRFLNGSSTGQSGEELHDEECTDVLSSIDYEGACRPVDERPRVAFFDNQGRVLDIRDYTNTEANNVNFNLHSFSGSRATVIACEDSLVAMIVYYDAMGGGKIAVDFKGTGPYR